MRCFQIVPRELDELIFARLRIPRVASMAVLYKRASHALTIQHKMANSRINILKKRASMVEQLNTVN